jgi:hypothetical protein
MASSQIRYRYGASVDDILAYPEIGEEFDKLAERLAPGWTPLEYRLAALYVRKNLRRCKREERSLFNRINASRADSAAKEVGPLDKVDIDAAEELDGIVGLMEKTGNASRFLYISQANDLPGLRPFTKSETFDALANCFWAPSLSAIFLVIYDIHDKFHSAPASLWANKLIQEKRPVFNYRIEVATRA